MTTFLNPLEIVRGDDFDCTLTWTDSAGTAINITGYTFYFTVKAAPDTDATDAAAVISHSWTSHSSPTTGVTHLTLTDTQTNVTPGTYWYDIQAKDGSANISTIALGQVTILADITRRTT